MPVCRICLGRDKKLYDMELCNLKTSYETLTNYLLPEDGLSRKLCWECRARLLACARFREKALRSRALLTAMAPFNQYDIARKLDSLNDLMLNRKSSLTAVHLGPLELCTTCSGVDKDESVFVTGRGATEDALMQSHRNMLIKKEGNNESMNEVEYSDLYEEHEVKPDLVLGPEMLQPQDIAFGPPQQPETPAAVITSQSPPLLVSLYSVFDIQNKEKPKEEGEIAKARPVEEVQNTEIDPVGSQKNSDAKNLKYCAECNFTTIYKHSLVLHQKIHTRTEPYKCNACSYICMGKKNLLMHKRTHKPFKCSHCSYTSSRKNDLLSHERTHTGEKPFKCSHCTYTSSWKSDLLIHERTHTGEKPYNCDICDYKAALTSSLKKHVMSVHAGVKHFKCSHCNYRSSRKSHLQRHKRTHTGEKPYKCDICDYKAARTTSLKVHFICSHKGVKPFKCSHCSYTSSQKSNIRRHERTHTGEKPYECDICDYKAAQSTSIKVHLMSAHAGVKPFKCSHCSYTCSQKSYLLIHERTHTGEKPFKCSHCSYTSSQKSHLLSHERTHTGEKAHKCDICDYRTAFTGNLKQHVKRIHTGEKKTLKSVI